MGRGSKTCYEASSRNAAGLSMHSFLRIVSERKMAPNIFLLQILLEFEKSLEEIEENLEGSLGNGCVLGIIGLGQGLCCSVSGDLRWF